MNNYISQKTIQIDGLPLCYLDTGGGGTPVLFQHGLCGSLAQTTEAFPIGNASRFISLECRGHGRSPLGDPNQISLGAFMGDLITLLGALELKSAVVGGISMGAALSLKLAVERPDIVNALILVRPAWTIERSPRNMLPNLVVGELLGRMPADEAKRQFLSGPTAEYLRREAPDNFATMVGFFAREPHAETAELLTRISLDGPGVSKENLRNLRIPCLVIGHKCDAIHPIEMAIELAENIPHASFVEITPKAEDKAAYLQDMHSAIDAFLGTLPNEKSK